MKKDAEKEFELVNLPSECKDKSISKDDFKLVQADKRIEEQKFQTKPTTFLKDSLKRFSKNKSSVVASFILGILVLLSIFVPLFCKDEKVHNSKADSKLSWLEPRLFDPKLGLGFWDGTKYIKNIPVDTSLDPDGIDPDKNWWPANYEKGAVMEGTKVFQKESYTDVASNYGKGGYVQFGYYTGIESRYDYVEYRMENFVSRSEMFSLEHKHYLSTFDVYDAAKMVASKEEKNEYPKNYEEGQAALYLKYKVYVPKENPEDPDIEQAEYDEMMILDYAKKFDIGVTGAKVDLNEIISKNLVDLELPLTTKFYDAYFEIRVKNYKDNQNACVLIKSIKFESNAPYAEDLVAYSFKDGNEANIRKSTEKGFWVDVIPSIKKTYLAKAVLCSFRYDTYEAKLGRMTEVVDATYIDRYVKDGKMTYSFEHIAGSEPGTRVVKPGTWKCQILRDDCPIAEPILEENVILTPFGKLKEANCTIMKYQKEYGLTKMPTFLLGTDASGKDMLIYVFEGLRTSLLLGIVTSAVCFIFGLIWGSVSGYFGGNVDLVMERLTDILHGIPWIVCMTLVIINLGSNLFTFAMALCLTGWIGTAATTRTQFYRFRGREYVLASRTLGASHGRIIAKHILPNAIGTIITSAVLMIPGVIFSEATISFLGLGFKNLPSLGVILSDNQSELTNHPFLLIFPSVIIALLMISFNLFGNGLRDAVNPSLKGEGE